MRRGHLNGGVLAMEKVREILRLYGLRMSERGIHQATGIARSTIQEYLRQAKVIGLKYEAALALSDDELRDIFKKSRPGRARAKVIEPDYEKIHNERHPLNLVSEQSQAFGISP